MYGAGGIQNGANSYGSRMGSTSYNDKYSDQNRRTYGASSVGPGQYRTPGYTSSKYNDVLGSRSSQRQSFKRYEDVLQRSYLADEFVIKNPANNNSCFLNVALQALWVCPVVRMNMVAFCEQRSGGPPELQPLVNAMQDFFQNASRTNQEDSELRRIHVLDSSAVRRELFKLNYKRGEYMIN